MMQLSLASFVNKEAQLHKLNYSASNNSPLGRVEIIIKEGFSICKVSLDEQIER